MSLLIAAKIIIAITAVAAMLSGCAGARLVLECAKGALGCN